MEASKNTSADSLPPDQGVALTNRSYGHGGYLAAGPDLFQDRTWVSIFATLMPTACADIQKMLDGSLSCTEACIYPCMGKYSSHSGKLMGMVENNPIVAAYATISMQAHKGNLPNLLKHSVAADWLPSHVGIEWDVHLDPKAVERWAAATDEKQRCDAARGLAETLLIAHGQRGHLVKENTVQPGQYWNIRQCPQTALGGLTACDWMDIYGKALRLGLLYCRGQIDDVLRLLENIRKLPRRPHLPTDQSSCDMFVHSVDPFADALRAYQQVCPGRVFSVFLDIKSRFGRPEMLADVFRALNSMGVYVDSVGHFAHAEISKSDAWGEQSVSVGDRTAKLPPVRLVKLFHTVGDIQYAMDQGRVALGDTLAFNGGCLLQWPRWCGPAEKMARYSISTPMVAYLKQLRARLHVHLHFYVQETILDRSALRMLVNLANEHPDIFDVGFSWGGITDAPADITPHWMGATVGLGGQGFVGRKFIPTATGINQSKASVQ